MPWIKTIDETEADGALKQIYNDQRCQAGAVANILKIHSLAPEVLSAHLTIYHAAMHAPGELSRGQREMIAVAYLPQMAAIIEYGITEQVCSA